MTYWTIVLTVAFGDKVPNFPLQNSCQMYVISNKLENASKQRKCWSKMFPSHPKCSPGVPAVPALFLMSGAGGNKSERFWTTILFGDGLRGPTRGGYFCYSTFDPSAVESTVHCSVWWTCNKPCLGLTFVRDWMDVQSLPEADPLFDLVSFICGVAFTAVYRTAVEPESHFNQNQNQTPGISK